MTTQRMQGMLGLAYRARQMAFGTDTVITRIRAGKAALVLLDKGAAENLFKKANDACAYYQVPLALLPEGLLGEACGKPGRMIACMAPCGFAEQLKDMLMKNQTTTQAESNAKCGGASAQ